MSWGANPIEVHPVGQAGEILPSRPPVPTAVDWRLLLQLDPVDFNNAC